MTIKCKWDRLWSNNIKSQEEWRDLALYHMIAAAINEKNEDLRINILFVCDSSSGKTEGLGLVKDILDKTEIPNKTYSEITDATLVGQYDRDAKRDNLKYGLTEENKRSTVKKRDGGEKIYEWQNPFRAGALKKLLSIGFSEAEQILEPKRYNEKLQSILREAMDKRREITKGVSSETFTYKTNSSFLFVTYPKRQVIMNIIDSGFLQRCFFLFKRVSDEEHHEICNHLGDISFTNKTSGKEDESLISEIANDLLSIQNFFAENKISFSDKLQQYAKKEIENYNNRLLELQDGQRKSFLQSSIRRGYSKISRITKLNAMIRLSTSVEQEDFNIAFDIYKKCLDSSLKLYDNLESSGKLKILIRTKIKESKSEKNKTQIVDEVYKEYTAKLGLKSGRLIRLGKNKVWDAFKLYEGKGFIIKDVNTKGLIWVDRPSKNK